MFALPARVLCFWSASYRHEQIKPLPRGGRSEHNENSLQSAGVARSPHPLPTFSEPDRNASNGTSEEVGVCNFPNWGWKNLKYCFFIFPLYLCRSLAAWQFVGRQSISLSYGIEILRILPGHPCTLVFVGYRSRCSRGSIKRLGLRLSARLVMDLSQTPKGRLNNFCIQTCRHQYLVHVKSCHLCCNIYMNKYFVRGKDMKPDSPSVSFCVFIQAPRMFWVANLVQEPRRKIWAELLNFKVCWINRLN